MGKMRFYTVFALFILVPFGLFACGSSGGSGGGGGEGSISYVVNGTSISLSDSQVAGAFNDNAVADPTIPAGHTVILGLQGSSGPGMLLVINGSTPGSYLVSNGDTSMSCSDGDTSADGVVYMAHKLLYNSSTAWEGVATITSFGGVGEMISGTFMMNTSALVKGGGPSGSIANVSGSFNVTRQANDSLY